jgi:hypothetical protein
MNVFLFERPPMLIHLATFHLARRSVDKTKLANREVIFLISYWRAEGSAGNGAGGIQIAGSGYGVEHWAWFIVCKFFEGFFVSRSCEEETARYVAREVRRETFAGGCGADANAVGDGRVCVLKSVAK